MLTTFNCICMRKERIFMFRCCDWRWIKWTMFLLAKFNIFSLWSYCFKQIFSTFSATKQCAWHFPYSLSLSFYSYKTIEWILFFFFLLFRCQYNLNLTVSHIRMGRKKFVWACSGWLKNIWCCCCWFFSLNVLRVSV